MHFSGLTHVLWAANFLGVAVLFFVLLFRRRWREFPVFTLLEGFYLASSIPLYVIDMYGSRIWYLRVDVAANSLNLVLWLGVIWEIARIVLRPTGSWVRDARKYFFLGSAAGILLAAALPFLIVRPSLDMSRVWDTRSGLFIYLVFSELVTILLLTSSRLGLVWRNHVMALAIGWGIEAAVGIVINGLHGYFGMHRYYEPLEHAGYALLLLVYVYWIVQFWREEPARKPISPELQAYILALHESVKRDKRNLDTINVQR